jgi:TPR repeat protein
MLLNCAHPDDYLTVRLGGQVRVKRFRRRDRNAELASEAEAWLRRAAEQGRVEAMHNLGVLMAERDDVHGAMAWFQRSADAGHPPAMFNVGVMLRSQGDDDSGLAWLHRSAEAGFPEAMAYLGDQAESDGDHAQAAAWRRRAADAEAGGSALFAPPERGEDSRSGRSPAVQVMAVAAMAALHTGDIRSAEKSFKMAAKAGDTESMFNLGVLFMRRGNPREAYGWYRMAAEAGDADGMAAIGILLLAQRR